MDEVSGQTFDRKAALSVPPFSQPTWIRPLPLPMGRHPLVGGLARFSQVDVVMAGDGGYVACRMDCDRLMDGSDDRNAASAALDRIMAARPAFAGLEMSRIHLMGVVNATPDSFSDGGQNLGPAQAIAAGKAMAAAGASLVDVGGESTRPGAAPVTRNQELARILPPITAMARAGITVSVDTRHADVMRRATAAGAAIINDVEALQGEVAAGIPMASIAIDPGFGFGKTVRHNLQLVNWLAMLHGLGVAVLFGASRKSSIAKISADEPADQRLPGSLALALAARRQAAQIIRVHDIAETAQALAVENALLTAAD